MPVGFPHTLNQVAGTACAVRGSIEQRDKSDLFGHLLGDLELTLIAPLVFILIGRRCKDFPLLPRCAIPDVPETRLPIACWHSNNRLFDEHSGLEG